jgi:Ca2+-binding RTX toxin-like protein
MVAGASPVSAAVSASFVNGTLTIDGNGGDDTIRVSRTPAGKILLNGAAIKGGPTVTNTDQVFINTGGGDNVVTLDLTNGLMAPGKDAEVTGKSEIEFFLSGGGSPQDTFQLIGRNVADQIDIGANGFNLNGDDDVDKVGGGFAIFVFKGGEGDDVIDARGNSVVGGGFPFPSTLDGGKGADKVFGGPAPMKLVGGLGNDFLVGGAFADNIIGGDGRDQLTGKGGKDNFVGGKGTDTLREVFNGNLTLSNSKLLGLGTDLLSSIERATLIGGKSNNTFDASAFSGIVVLKGAGGNDTLRGGKAADQLFGEADNDKLFGYASNDLLNGGPGKDYGDGGAGADTFVAIETKVN